MQMEMLYAENYKTTVYSVNVLWILKKNKIYVICCVLCMMFNLTKHNHKMENIDRSLLTFRLTKVKYTVSYYNVIQNIVSLYS